MGGCRCTYKNCTIRSDGKTHLFHYPVFDKIRCHEWLSKAGRYDFLNLKVSQLKNRCICQHHFEDHWFMNDKKEKLKSKAVPTLDGPFCDSSNFTDPDMPQNMMGLYPLACEVVENDDFILDRKSNYNLVYSDFLTNSEVMESLNITPKIPKEEDIKSFTDIENVTPAVNNNITEVGYEFDNANPNKTIQTRSNKKDNLFIVRDMGHEMPLLTVEHANINGKNMIKVEVPPMSVDHNINKSKEILPIQEKKKSRVRIISEKKITEPEKKICVPVSNASFEVVKPSMILNISKDRAKNKQNASVPQVVHAKADSIILHNKNSNMANEITVVPNTDSTIPALFDNMVLDPCKEETNITDILSNNDPSKFEMNIQISDLIPPPPKVTTPHHKINATRPSIKTKMSPERVAAINEKRKFNMKLKDIIAEELDRLEEQSSAGRLNTLVPHKKNRINNIASNESVLSSLSKEPTLPNEHAYIVHYLEARMERMENLLLNKIDQNTQKIMSLTRTLDSQEDAVSLTNEKSSRKRNSSDEAHKRQLYKDISKYLTPESKSLIYEELFINKFEPIMPKTDTVPSKRTRRR